MIQMKLFSDLKNEIPDINKIKKECVELALDEADRMAIKDKTRLSQEEVFGDLRRKVNG